MSVDRHQQFHCYYNFSCAVETLGVDNEVGYHHHRALKDFEKVDFVLDLVGSSFAT